MPTQPIQPSQFTQPDFLPEELKDFLNQKVVQYNRPNFIEEDPIQIPKSFSKNEDIEISGLLTALIAWGRRDIIINNATKMMGLFGNEPHRFVVEHSSADLKALESFNHRTFFGIDLIFLVTALKVIYSKHESLEKAFLTGDSVEEAIIGIRTEIFQNKHLSRTQKHFANPVKGSSAKRLNMFLRWMVRSDDAGVDFGIWNKTWTPKLLMPLDVHTARVGRKLGLLKRKQNDWKAVNELTNSLRHLDANDPVKYDYALFGLGVFEGF